MNELPKQKLSRLPNCLECINCCHYFEEFPTTKGKGFKEQNLYWGKAQTNSREPSRTRLGETKFLCEKMRKKAATWNLKHNNLFPSASNIAA